MIIPNIWKNKKYSKPPTRYVSGNRMRETVVVIGSFYTKEGMYLHDNDQKSF